MSFRKCKYCKSFHPEEGYCVKFEFCPSEDDICSLFCYDKSKRTQSDKPEKPCRTCNFFNPNKQNGYCELHHKVCDDYGTRRNHW